jgi:glutamyl-tRNA reductase
MAGFSDQPARGFEMSELLALGISHKTAPVALRERLAFSEVQAREFAEQAIQTAEVREAVVISTCNRTEIYLVVGDPVRAEGDILGLLARRADIRPTELAEAIYSPRNCDAARHLYRVTSGLESMIVGEAEIQGQVRRAHETALQAGCTGPLSNRLFAAALTTGKRVRSETGIGAGRASVPSVAVELAQSVLRGSGAEEGTPDADAGTPDAGDGTPDADAGTPGAGDGTPDAGAGTPGASSATRDGRRAGKRPPGLADRHVVILGAGEMSELTARALSEQGAGTIFVANRHADRALHLAERFGGVVVGLDGLPDQLERADIVLCSTASPQPIVGRDELAQVMRERDHRPLLLIDIAVPRDVDPGCAELDGVSLYDIDDLQAVIARNLDTRASEIPRAQEIIEQEIQRFARWLGQLDVLPTVSALREHGAAIVEQVLAENDGHWESASPRDLARVEAIARAVMSRLLHEPTIRLRSHGERGHASIELVRELFGLREDEPRHRPQADLAEVHSIQGRRRR